MSNNLSKQIEELPIQMQEEVLIYIDSLMKRGPQQESNVVPRMTLDRFQDRQFMDKKQEGSPSEENNYPVRMR